MSNDPTPTHALVRPPGAAYAQAISSTRARIDVTLAQAQHAEYCRALSAAGLAVDILPADERFPDGCFVQDPALVVAGQAVICRLGAPTRRGEEEAVCARLAGHFPLARIEPPGTLEGGDVLALPGRLLVGESARSNRAGIEQLAHVVAPFGMAVIAVPVSDRLHLLTALTYLGHNLLLAVAGATAHPAFAGLEIVSVPADEAYAANALAVGDHVILPAGYPRTAQALSERGFTVLATPMSEFAKADGGVTCLSLLW